MFLSAVCLVPCQNGGVCSSPGRCTCPKGFTGNYCQIGKTNRVIPHSLLALLKGILPPTSSLLNHPKIDRFDYILVQRLEVTPCPALMKLLGSLLRLGAERISIMEEFRARRRKWASLNIPSPRGTLHFTAPRFEMSLYFFPLLNFSNFFKIN